eukprot:474887-Rhodomonas_salina.2
MRVSSFPFLALRSCHSLRSSIGGAAVGAADQTATRSVFHHSLDPSDSGCQRALYVRLQTPVAMVHWLLFVNDTSMRLAAAQKFEREVFGLAESGSTWVKPGLKAVCHEGLRRQLVSVEWPLQALSELHADSERNGRGLRSASV